MNSVFKEYGLKDLLPLKLDIPDEGCTRPNKNMYCFEAGKLKYKVFSIKVIPSRLCVKWITRLTFKAHCVGGPALK